MRLAPGILTLLMVWPLAGCGPSLLGDPASGQVESAAPLAMGEMRAGFIPGRDQDVIVVSGLDRFAIRSATLIMPDGRRIPADSIDAEPSPTVSGQATLDALHPIRTYTLAMPTGPLPQGAPHEEVREIGLIRSDVRIVIPERAAYRAEWARARIEVTSGPDPAEVTTTNLAAPAPR